MVLKRGGTGLIGLIIAGLTVAACLRSGPEVVVYTSEDQVFSEPVLKDFEKTSGIKVRAVYDTEETKSTGVALRIVAERARPQADVFWANEPLRTVMLQQQGLPKRIARQAPTTFPLAIAIPVPTGQASLPEHA